MNVGAVDLVEVEDSAAVELEDPPVSEEGKEAEVDPLGVGVVSAVVLTGLPLATMVDDKKHMPVLKSLPCFFDSYWYIESCNLTLASELQFAL